jgi:MYXO-CTERM domain-containing protein
MIRVARGVAALLVCLPVVASADKPVQPVRPRLDYVTRPPMMDQPTAVLDSQVIYLNNCADGCTITPGNDDAANGVSSIASTTAHLTEFAWQPGEWEAIVKCVQEVYSPYNVTVTDVRPQSVFNMAVVAGNPEDIGYAQGAGGVAVVSGDCSPRQNSIAYAFAEMADVFAQEDGGNRVWGECWVISQEVAHIYGLDHEYAYVDDNSSACNDPMTYREDCGGQKFFRNRAASCGEFGPARPGCGPANNCSTAQNSHARLLNIFGPGTPTTKAPEAAVLNPHPNDTIANGATVAISASAQRGVAKVELWINGYKWAEKAGNAFGPMGQTDTTYTIALPGNVPDGVMDIVVKAFDDIGIEGDSTTVTVTKGAPCADASTCADGQKCDAGKCFWDPPTGVLGDDCTYPQFCMSGMCEGTSDKQICTQGCVVGSTDACPAGFDCVATSGNNGICFTQDSGGCCSTGGSGSSKAVYAQAGLALALVAFATRRRRRRR